MPKGGKRPNAGRPKGGKYNEETKLVRLPLSRINAVKKFLDNGTVWQIPLYANKVAAGFPSPADDYIESYLDLNVRYVKNSAATFFVTVSGDSMQNIGIHHGDILIVDKSIQPVHGHIVIAAVDGELTVKRLSQVNGKTQLLPENPAYSPIEIKEGQEVFVWGVVIHGIKNF